MSANQGTSGPSPRTCLTCGVASPTRWMRWWHNSLWTYYGNTCRAVLTAERIDMLTKQVEVHRKNAEQWDRIAAAWDELIAAKTKGSTRWHACCKALTLARPMGEWPDYGDHDVACPSRKGSGT